jgi:hypothetical protein
MSQSRSAGSSTLCPTSWRATVAPGIPSPFSSTPRPPSPIKSASSRGRRGPDQRQPCCTSRARRGASRMGRPSQRRKRTGFTRGGALESSPRASAAPTRCARCRRMLARFSQPRWMRPCQGAPRGGGMRWKRLASPLWGSRCVATEPSTLTPQPTLTPHPSPPHPSPFAARP